MTAAHIDFSAFKKRLTAGEKLIGTFVKTPSPIVCEVLGQTGLDVVCLDAEHAPFDRLAIDACVQTLRSAAMPSMVRLPSAAPEQILGALDSGATGILVPHVVSPGQAEQIVQAAHFGPGGRGYAGSTRAAGFMGRPIVEHLANSARETVVVLQIEDLEAVDAIEEIAAVDGIDCLFIGRIDLTVALSADSPQSPEVISCVEKICRVAREAKCPVGMYVPHVSEAERWMEQGAGLFLLESDHTLMARGADALARDFRGE